jgi:hypothetical protein
LCHSWNVVDPADYTEHLELLIDYMKTAYEATTQHLESLLQSGQITYDLLWALFKPNSLVYTTCYGTGRPRCVKYDFNEEKETLEGEKYRSLDCRYLDFDGEKLGEAETKLKIPKFHGTKRINALQAFPLQYHSDINKAKANLIQCGRKFVSLRGPNHRHCHGRAFYIYKDKVVQKSINSRVMIDAAFFQELNPNNSRQRVTEPIGTDWDSAGEWQLSHDSSGGSPRQQVRGNGMEAVELTEDELLICCPTVPGFSFGDKLWRKLFSSNSGTIR